MNAEHRRVRKRIAVAALFALLIAGCGPAAIGAIVGSSGGGSGGGTPTLIWGAGQWDRATWGQ